VEATNESDRAPRGRLRPGVELYKTFGVESTDECAKLLTGRQNMKIGARGCSSG
jgi:hypothetical protein